MASRWMQGVKARERGHRRRQGNASLTGYQTFIIREDDKGVPRKTLTREERFYRPKMNETVDQHIARMNSEAAFERLRATEWWRRLARVLGPNLDNLDDHERDLVNKFARENRSVQETQEAILRYRRLTGYKPPPTQEELKKRKRQLAEERRRNKPEETATDKKLKAKARRKARKPVGSGFLIKLD